MKLRLGLIALLLCGGIAPAQSIVPLTEQLHASPNTAYNQIWSRGVRDRNGRNWFCFSQGSDTYLVGYNADGTLFSAPQRVNQVTHLQQDECEIYICALSNNILIVWSDRSSFYTDYMCAMGRGYNNLGQPLTNEFPLFSTNLFGQTQWRPLAVPLRKGGFAVTATTNWGEDVVYNIVAAEAPPITPGIIVNSPQFAYNNQEYPAVAENIDGDVAIVWREHNGSAAGGQTASNLPDLVGTVIRDFKPLFAEKRLTGAPASIGPQFEPRLVSTGHIFFMVWQSGSDVYVRRFTRSLAPTSPSIVVNQVTAGSQKDPQVAITRAGSLVVIWESVSLSGESSIKARWLKKDLSFLTDEFQVNTLSVGFPSNSQIDRATPSIFIRRRRMLTTWGGIGNQRDIFYREFVVQ